MIFLHSVLYSIGFVEALPLIGKSAQSQGKGIAVAYYAVRRVLLPRIGKVEGVGVAYFAFISTQELLN